MDEDGIEIPITFDYGAAVTQLRRELSSLTANVSVSAGGGNVGVGGVPTTRGGGSGRASRSAGPPPITGPMSRLERAQAALSRAQTPQQIADARYNLSRAQRAVDGMHGGGGGGLAGLPMLTRLVRGGAGGGAVTAAVAGVVALNAAAQKAARSLNDFRDSQTTGGGTASETARMQGMGVSPGLARSFSDRISSDPTAAAFAAQGGVYDFGIFDDTNKAAKLLKWADALRRMSEAEATRAARATGTEELLKFRDVSDKTMQQLKEDAEIRARLFTPAMTRSAREYEMQTQRLATAFDTLSTRASAPVITGLTTVFEAVTGFLNQVSGFSWAGLRQNMSGQGARVGGGWLAPPIISGSARAGADRQASATERNTQAIIQLNASLRAGVHGAGAGSDMARGALPGAWRGRAGWAFGNSYADIANTLGAFGTV